MNMTKTYNYLLKDGIVIYQDTLMNYGTMISSNKILKKRRKK